MRFIYNNVEYTGELIEPQYKNVFFFDIGETFIPFQDLLKQSDRLFIQLHIETELHKICKARFSDKISVNKNSIKII